MNNTKILPCPKCGAKGKLTYIMDAVAVCCTNENCRHMGDSYLVYSVFGDCPNAPKNAIRDWNERR